MWSFVAFLFWLALAQLALVLLAFAFRRFFQVEHQRSAVHFIDTDDGWRLALSRHQPARPRRGSPILLIPGFGFSAAIFEVGDNAWAPMLAEEGFDVWLLDPRGRGMSSRPRLFGRHRGSWSLDDVMEFDIPAAVEAVCSQTGVEQIHLLAFGGGALLALPATVGQRIRSITALGAAAYFSRQQEHVSTRWLGVLRWLRPRFLLRLLAPLLGRFDLPPLRALQLLDNIDGLTYRQALVEAVVDFSPRELRQLRGWFDDDVYRGLEEGPDYRERLGMVSAPILFVGGPRDRLAPPAMVRATAEACIGARERSLMVANREEGLSCNYGHLDLLLGRALRRDLRPRVIEWLERWDESTGDGLARVPTDEHEGIEASLPRPEDGAPPEDPMEDAGPAAADDVAGDEGAVAPESRAATRDAARSAAEDLL